MAKQLQLRRGTTSEHSTFTGVTGEITVDTDKDTLVVHDGVTAGGTSLATAADNNLKADTTYVDAELATKQDTLVSGTNIKTVNDFDITGSGNVDIPSGMNKVASNVLMEGNLALASSAVTKSNANITYTGNGSTQSITTGIASVDFTVASNGSGYYHDRTAGDCIVKNDAGTIIESGSCVVNTSKVHIKSRNNVAWNTVSDGLRGTNKNIFTNETNAEDSVLGRVESFNNGSISVGSDGNVNALSWTYILHQTLYTHIKWGLTNQGKRYLTAYNPVTREVMTMYQGSGIAGHQIPNALGIKLDWFICKNLDTVAAWRGRTELINDDEYLDYDTGASTVSDTIFNGGQTSAYNTLQINAAVNNANDTLIMYGFANSETKIITQYQGTGASGNFVETKDVNGVARKPRRVIIKRTDSTGSWYAHDSERGDDNYIALNLSIIENSIGIDFSHNGLFVQNTNADYNTSGGQYIAIVEFDTTNSNDDTYFDLPTDNSVVNLTNAILGFTEGINTNGYNTSSESITAANISASGISDGIYYVYKNKNGSYGFDSVEPTFAGSSAETNGYYFNTNDGKWYNDSDIEQTSRSYIMKVIVASETIMDIL